MNVRRTDNQIHKDPHKMWVLKLKGSNTLLKKKYDLDYITGIAFYTITCKFYYENINCKYINKPTLITLQTTNKVYQVYLLPCISCTS